MYYRMLVMVAVVAMAIGIVVGIGPKVKTPSEPPAVTQIGEPWTGNQWPHVSCEPN